MSYNEIHFDDELNNRLYQRLRNLKLGQDRVLDFLKRYLLASNDKKQLKHCDAFLQLLVKMRFNLESVNLLLPIMFDDYRFKTSINLIYRGIIDDIINSYYLFGTVALADPDQIALNNELTILHKEFILSSIRGIKAGQKFNQYVESLNGSVNTNNINITKQFKKLNPEITDANGNWKKNKELRESSNPYFINLLDQGDSNGFISETTKLKFIKARGIKTHDNLEALFKYLSQYQHFSPKAHSLLLNHIEYDIVIYQHCVGELVMLLDQLLQFLELKGKSIIKKEWDDLAPYIFKSFSN